VIEQLPPVSTPSGVLLASEVTSEGDSDGAMPVVFLHATGFSRGVWRPVARRLAGGVPGIALDLRGHGDSGKPAPPYRWSLFAEDVAAYVGQLPARQVVLCGHSMGGATAAEVAAQLPDRVAGLVLVEPALTPPASEAQPAPSPDQESLLRTTLRRSSTWPDRATAEHHLAGRSPYCHWDREVLAGYFATGLTSAEGGGCTLSCPPEVEASIYAEAPASAAWSRLPSIACPVRVLRGAGDRGMASTASPLIAQIVPDGLDRVAADSGHFVPMEQPGLVAGFVDEMLAAVRDAR
jgi:pimeloyl-ACP methyl ester carboxylesterase